MPVNIDTLVLGPRDQAASMQEVRRYYTDLAVVCPRATSRYGRLFQADGMFVGLASKDEAEDCAFQKREAREKADLDPRGVIPVPGYGPCYVDDTEAMFSAEDLYFDATSMGPF